MTPRALLTSKYLPPATEGNGAPTVDARLEDYEWLPATIGGTRD